jgi:hypothetical protein
VLPDLPDGSLLWSPDGRSWLGIRYYCGAGWGLYTMPASGAGGETIVACDIPTNNQKSWPGRDDITWQAVQE